MNFDGEFWVENYEGEFWVGGLGGRECYQILKDRKVDIKVE